MAGDRWHESGDAPYNKSDYTPADAPRRRKVPAQKAPDEGKYYEQDDDRPRKSMRAAIIEIVKADPTKTIDEIKREAKELGYVAPELTVTNIRSETLGLWPYNKGRRERHSK